MSIPDYCQLAEDHQAILVVVKQIASENELSNKSFNKLFERIERLTQVKIEDAQGMGCERIIRLRFVKEYEPVNNEWGDFQAHRKVLGLITVAATSSLETMSDIHALHETSTHQYSSTLLDSRCLVLNSGIRSDDGVGKKFVITDDTENGDTSSEPILLQNTKAPVGVSNSTGSVEAIELNQERELMEKSTNLSEKMRKVSSNSKHRAVQTAIYNLKFTGGEEISDFSLHSIEDAVEKDIQNFVSSLFWVLESKRLDRSFEKIEKSTLLVAPFEGKTLVGVDTDTKNFKKRCLGRMRKHAADLSLLAGHPSEALSLYSNSISTLKTVNDWLWLAAAFEGQCVASLAILFPPSKRKTSLQRNASLPPSKFKKLQDDVKTFEDGSIKSKVFDASNKKAGYNSLGNGIDPVMAKALGKNLLATATEIYDKYKEACCHYAKFKQASIVEMECSFKAARALTLLEKYMGASEFIQNAVFISLNLSHQENTKRLIVVSNLYTEIGYHRKAAFYKRFAALKAVSLNLTEPNWNQCYSLLLPAIEGYHLNLDPSDYSRRAQLTSRAIGWIGIHLQLLQELVTTARRLKQDHLAVRHLSFLLHSLFEFLTPSQRQDFASQLSHLTSKNIEGIPAPLVLDNGSVIPTVNFTKFPYATSFKVETLAQNIRPYKTKSALDKLNSTFPSSPFIFTPMQMNRSNNRKVSSTGQIEEFYWVENEQCEVSMTVRNYLPIELVVSDITLLTSGVPFETHPSSLVLAPDCGQLSVILSGFPRGHGKLEILGYKTEVFGVKSKCYLKDIPLSGRTKLPPSYQIEVVPPLPLLSVSCPDMQQSSLITPLSGPDGNQCTSSYSLQLFMGQRKSVKIQLSNITAGNIPLEEITVKTVTKLKKVDEDAFISFGCDIKEKLPLVKGETLDFIVDFYGFGDFVLEPERVPKGTGHSGKPGNSSPTSQSSSSALNTPSHSKKQPLQLGTVLANFISDLQSSSSVSAVKLAKNAKSSNEGDVSSHDFSSRTIEVQIEFEYSGGIGMGSAFCRHCSIRFNVEIFPSVVITQWDVLPAEAHDRCFLVVDVVNASCHEMELGYASNKSILIEPKETCRIPIPIERCPLEAENGDVLVGTVQQKCKEHISAQVNLFYSLNGSDDIRGNTSIDRIEWTAQMMTAILMSPVRWKVSLNEQDISSDKPEFTCKVGHAVKCRILVSNTSDHCIKSLCLWGQVYQDHHNGTRNHRLEMKRATVGSDKVFICEIAPRSEYHHEMSLIFFYSGVYKLDIQCSGFDCGSLSEIRLATADEGVTSSKSPLSMWKCMPSIEISSE
ncbi:Trafficking protein particle complex subunit 9 [Halotydeus destructor]|nr:Trafficking protein particle complex subunit 9 [Halotydeus destructor]